MKLYHPLSSDSDGSSRFLAGTTPCTMLLRVWPKSLVREEQRANGEYWIALKSPWSDIPSEFLIEMVGSRNLSKHEWQIELRRVLALPHDTLQAEVTVWLLSKSR